MALPILPPDDLPAQAAASALLVPRPCQLALVEQELCKQVDNAARNFVPLITVAAVLPETADAELAVPLGRRPGLGSLTHPQSRRLLKSLTVAGKKFASKLQVRD